MKQAILDIAIKEIGVVEEPAGSNLVKYNDWIYNVKGKAGAWCGAFVSWCFAMAGYSLGRIDMLKGFVGCPFAVANVSKWGRIVTVPEPCDVVFFDWDGDGRFDHTGIFEKDLGNGYFSCIEGNTSMPKSGDIKEIKKANSNGGMVMRRADRKYKNAIFVRPFVITDKP